MQLAKANPDFDGNLALDLYYIDYTQPWNNSESSFDVQTTFTLLDWKICDLVVADPQFNVGDIDQEQQMQLALNIFPGCYSLLHKLAIGGKDMIGNENSTDGHDSIMKSTHDLFQTAKKNFDFGLLGTDGGCSLEIPLI